MQPEELTQTHEEAEKIATSLGIAVSGSVVKIGRYRADAASILRAYIKTWGIQYAANPGYLEPSKLLSLLNDIASANAELTKRELAGTYFYDVFEYIDACFNALQIDISDNNVWTCKRKNRIVAFSMGNFLNYLKSHLPAYNNSIPQDLGIPKLQSEALTPALQVFIKNRQMDRMIHLQQLLAYSSANDTNPDLFAVGLLKIYFVEPSPANIAALKHLVWSIKRNIAMLPVPEPLFYCLHSSKQRMGKTTFFKKLCQGFDWIYSPSGQLNHLLNVNDYKAMCRNKFLLDFQELTIGNLRNRHTGTIDESIVATLKSIITTDVISGREMYMSEDSTEQQITVFVSSTNKHVWDVINDTSGMRRYWEFNIRPPKEYDPQFYLAANVYFDNILDFYRSIDENNPLGYYHPDAPEYPEMRHIQDSYARENPFLTFCHTNGWSFVSENEPEAKKIDIKRLLLLFNNYLMNRGDPKWTARSIQFVISAYADTIPERILDNNKMKEIYWMKGDSL